jgi:hypothetical protein
METETISMPIFKPITSISSNRCEFIHPVQQLSFTDKTKRDGIRCNRIVSNNSSFCNKHINTLQDYCSKKVILIVEGVHYIFKNLEAIAQIEGLKVTKLTPSNIVNLEKNNYSIHSFAKT